MIENKYNIFVQSKFPDTCWKFPDARQKFVPIWKFSNTCRKIPDARRKFWAVFETLSQRPDSWIRTDIGTTRLNHDSVKIRSKRSEVFSFPDASVWMEGWLLVVVRGGGWWPGSQCFYPGRSPRDISLGVRLDQPVCAGGCLLDSAWGRIGKILFCKNALLLSQKCSPIFFGKMLS